MASLNKLHKKQTKAKKGTSNSGYTVVLLSILLLGVLVLFQAFRWQIIEREKFITLAAQQYNNNSKELPQRGKILAKDGTILAVDEPVWNVYASLSSDEMEREEFFSQKAEFVSEVATILGITREEINAKLTDDFRYVKIYEGISNEKKSALESIDVFDIPNLGLYFEKDVRRTYPNNTLASHVLGFIGKNSEGEYVGQYGIEGYYFTDIEGQAGYFSGEKDSSGNVILNEEYNPLQARSGKTFRLTIEPSIQLKVEEALEKGVKETQSKSGTVIIMNPKTGAIIAMANYPNYNPNEYWLTQEPWIFKNLAVSDVYEYGSTHKPITVAIAIESGIPKDFKCNDSTGYLDLYEATGYADLKGRKIYTWNRKPNGIQGFAEMFANSNNPCIARTALEIDYQYYYNKLKEFGIGTSINIGLQEESTSYLKPFDFWTRLDIITSSYGQAISATPLQVISAISTIANDGKRMQPYIVDAMIDEEETHVTESQVISQPISEDTADSVAQMMRAVVEDGGIFVTEKERVKDYEISAKTGTAQVVQVGEVGYQEGATIATYVGFAPTSDPKMIMLVRLAESQAAEFSSYTAVPLWNDIFLDIVNDLEIPKRN
ncbi:MAG: peptidoglycan glycosyltransferase [candidate division WS6 bacterium 34_10]|uniref:Peptidoglycan glycosyltransferase n=1 Tax=candidate division WS6 bacterium 34_10 TaxID=1641389 RepID=A0A101HGK7_9BACT|nr:MAG: peptidoglycan glycosyltransferase [candidate division WS6 bacterium 34_10]